MGLQDDLDRIAELQGKVVPRGDRIEGFGPGNPPPPEASIPSAREFYGAPIETQQEPEPEAYDDGPTIEPIIPRVSPEIPRQAPPVDMDLASLVAGASLIVVDGRAEYQGRRVKLTESEQAQASYVILRAILRSIREQESEIAGKLPKKGKRIKPVPVVELPKKKRGRPRKQA